MQASARGSRSVSKRGHGSPGELSFRDDTQRLAYREKSMHRADSTACVRASIDFRYHCAWKIFRSRSCMVRGIRRSTERSLFNLFVTPFVKIKWQSVVENILSIAYNSKKKLITDNKLIMRCCVPVYLAYQKCLFSENLDFISEWKYIRIDMLVVINAQTERL